MENIKLIKDGKFYNTDTSELIAVSTWFTNYDTKRHKIYKTAKGVYFMVVEIAETFSDTHLYAVLSDGTKTAMGYVTLSQYSLAPKDGGFRDDVKIKDVQVISEISESDVRSKFESVSRGLMFQFSTYAKGKYKFFKSYDKLFEIQEA